MGRSDEYESVWRLSLSRALPSFGHCVRSFVGTGRQQPSDPIFCGSLVVQATCAREFPPLASRVVRSFCSLPVQHLQACDEDSRRTKGPDSVVGKWLSCCNSFRYPHCRWDIATSKNCT